jgi:hypothetical protein
MKRNLTPLGQMNNNDLIKRIDELELRIKNLENMENIDFMKRLREAVFGQPSGGNDGAVDQTITIGDMGGSASVPDFPDGFLEAIRPNGDRVLLPTYSKSRF